MSTLRDRLRRPLEIDPDWRRPHQWLALGFGAGLSPLMPGTVGTLLGVPLYLLLAGLAPVLYLLAVSVLFAIGVAVCGATARDLRNPDPKAVVWDEIVGFAVTMTGTPPRWYWVCAGFLLFRFFDILKPWPVGYLDRRVKGGLGIMLDDLAAGLMALACLQLLRSWA